MREIRGRTGRPLPPLFAHLDHPQSETLQHNAVQASRPRGTVIRSCLRCGRLKSMIQSARVREGPATRCGLRGSSWSRQLSALGPGKLRRALRATELRSGDDVHAICARYGVAIRTHGNGLGFEGAGRGRYDVEDRAGTVMGLLGSVAE